MKSVFSFYLRYIVFILGIQILFSIFFLVVYHKLAQGAGLGSECMALLYGMKLNFSLTAYILLFPTFLLIIFSILRKSFLRIALGVFQPG